MFLRHAEISGDEQEHEEVVHAEREFDDVAGDDFERRLLPFCQLYRSPANAKEKAIQMALRMMALRNETRSRAGTHRDRRQHHQHEH